MKTAIMQPYFFPYIGYFQLIHAVDVFVVYDNIKYTKKGWINRNRILQHGEASVISIPIQKDSDFLDVRDRRVAPTFNPTKLMNKIHAAYHKAPYFKEVSRFIEQVIYHHEENLFEYIYHSIVKICDYLGLDTKVVISSTLDIDHTWRAQDKVIAICKALDSTHYINPIGGTSLYSKADFQRNGLQLSFLQTRDLVYTQYENSFVPFLSIIDVMMFNSPEEITDMLNQYDLI